MVCVSCNNKNNFRKNIYKTFNRNEEFSIYECQNCGLGFLHPVINFKNIENEYYNKNYHAYQILDNNKSFFRKLKNFIKVNSLEQYLDYGDRKFWKKITYPFFIRVSFYPRKVINGKFLSVGPGAGQQLVYNKELGWDVYGVDISKMAVEIAKKRGFNNIFNGTLNEAKFESDFFDVVDLHHVFEHIGNPIETLTEIRRILKKDGEVIITLPNYSSFSKKVFGKYWGGWDVPRHFFFYSKKTLSKLVERNGFKVDEVWHSDTFRGISAGLAYLIFRKNARKYEKYFIPFGVFLDLFFDPLLQKFGSGDQLTIKARKI